jgi:magnesium-transporting ATPase (P-type)
VLAIAERELPAAERHPDDWRVEEVEREVVLLGLVAMDDPPRSEVPAAIAACRAAGIRVVMVTGDNGLTAATIGREIGLHPVEPYVVDGMKLDTLTDAALGQLLDHPDLLFARVAPEHKLRLVEAFQRRGEIVAVTGDGVNDAPALRRADVGVAMGKTGTDVARAAADMVLADDHFASIVFAIEEGRTVYDNVRKFATYILASNVPEAVPFIVFVLFGVPLPLTIMQILAVDLGTDLLPALALGAELPERDVMHRPPRPRNARLLDVPTLWRAYAWLGMLEALLGLAAYYFAQWWAGWRPGLPLAAEGPAYVVATTMSLAAIVACQVGNLFACRSAWQSAWRLPWFQNRLLWWGIAFEIGLLALLIYTPPLARIFNLAPLSPVHWLALGFLGPTLLGLEELRKAWLRRQPGR